MFLYMLTVCIYNRDIITKIPVYKARQIPDVGFPAATGFTFVTLIKPRLAKLGGLRVVLAINLYKTTNGIISPINYIETNMAYLGIWLL